MKTILALTLACFASVASADHAKGLRAPFGWKARATFHKVKRVKAVLPARFNLADKIGHPLPVKDQGTCGDCWNFGTSSSVELSYYWREGVYVEVSTQEGLSCSGAGTCDGGYFDALNYLVSHGIGREIDWPYQAQDLACRAIPSRLQIAAWAYIGTPGRTPQVDEIKQVIASGRAVAASVTADQRLESYTGGLFKGSRKPGPVNHIVTIVGYDESGWDVLNSWGLKWGEDGHAHMKYGANRIGETATVVYLK